MGLLIKASDFVGDYQIAQTTHGNNIDFYIEKYEEKYLQELMGVELLKLLKASVSSPNTVPPADPLYLAIYAPFAEDEKDVCYDFYFMYDYCAPLRGRIRRSVGLKEMLLGFVYFEYMRKQKYTPTSSGTVVNANENSRETSFDYNGLYQRYNDSVDTYHTIQWYIFKNKPVSYPTFNGQRKQHSYFI